MSSILKQQLAMEIDTAERKRKFNQMEQKHELSTLSSDYPWLIAHNLDPEEDNTGDQIFFTIHDPITRFRCQIPVLVGRCIRGCFHGWMILSKDNLDNIEWSLWNPVISKLIRLPPWILKDEDDEDDFQHCCLTSPPDDPAGSILLLMRGTKPNIAFFNCKTRKKSRRWTEMSYSKQLKKKPGNHDYDPTLFHPTCCNGNIYALSHVSYPPLLIQLQIVVEEKQTVINLLPLVKLPRSKVDDFVSADFFLKGSCTQLFTIGVGAMRDGAPCDVNLFKLDMGSMKWTEINDLKDTVFFVHMESIDYDLVYSSPPIASELGGGYIHILKEQGDVIYSYNIKDKTISIMSLTHRYDLPLCSISVWPTTPEFKLPKCKDGDDDHHQTVMVTSSTATNKDDDDGETKNEDCLLVNIPFDVLEMIMKFCVGIEYLNFRATCKLCRLAAPMIQWSNERLRLETYSLVSPWLMVMDKCQGIITFRDPVFGDNKYFMKASPELFYDDRILCSRYGWLLLYIAKNRVTFFNPFTTNTIALPPIRNYNNFSFSAPPTSPDCMVFASRLCERSMKYRVHHVGRNPFIWHRFSYEFGDEGLHFSWFPTFCGKDVYSLFNSGVRDGGGLEVFKEIDNHDNPPRTQIVDFDTAPSHISAKYYHVKCDEHHLLVMVGMYGEAVEVFKLNDCKREWEKIDGLGSHMIYICEASCVCMKAKIPEMENKIYFPRLHSKKDKIVFYSMDTCKFHTFNGRKVEQNILTDLFGTKQSVYAHAWIEPTWS